MHELRRWAPDGVLVLLGAGEAGSVLAASPDHVLAAVVSGLSVLVLLARRWQPLAATVAAFALMGMALAAVVPITIVQFFGVLATFAVAGAVNRLREAVVAWVAGASMLAYGTWHSATSGRVGDYALTMAFATTMWGAGVLVRRRTGDTAAAVLRAERAEHEREEQARLAVAEERARIARDLHDVVSHGLSVIVLQTMAARAGLADGEQVERRLDAVEETARESLGEMRRMLGLLQAADISGAPDAPAPGLAALPALVERAASAGLRTAPPAVDVPVALPGGLELSVHRVVQETLTNAVKHAPGSAVRVAVVVRDGAAVVTVTNGPGTGPGSAPAGAGHGLVGMQQRTALYGGSLTAGPTPDGGFAVVATFPLPEPAAPRRRFARREAPA